MSRAETVAKRGSDLTHGMADIEPGLRLHYVTAGSGPRVVVLLHGFPQTWHEQGDDMRRRPGVDD